MSTPKKKPAPETNNTPEPQPTGDIHVAPSTVRESSQQAGVRLANQRMSFLQQRLESIARLGQYKLSSEQKRIITDQIHKWTSDALARLNSGKEERETFFLR